MLASPKALPREPVSVLLPILKQLLCFQNRNVSSAHIEGGPYRPAKNQDPEAQL